MNAQWAPPLMNGTPVCQVHIIPIPQVHSAFSLKKCNPLMMLEKGTLTYPDYGLEDHPAYVSKLFSHPSGSEL